jgi:hypothetical protein
VALAKALGVAQAAGPENATAPGARVAAAALLRCVAVHGRRCHELLPPALATTLAAGAARSLPFVSVRPRSKWSTAHDGLVGDSEVRKFTAPSATTRFQSVPIGLAILRNPLLR